MIIMHYLYYWYFLKITGFGMHIFVIRKETLQRLYLHTTYSFFFIPGVSLTIWDVNLLLSWTYMKILLIHV